MPKVRLAPDYWKFVLFHELKGHTQAEIAKALGCSQGTVSNRFKTMNFTMEELILLNRKLGINIRKVVDSF